MPPGIETISDPVVVNFISKLQVYLNHSVNTIFGAQTRISLLNSNMGDMPEDLTVIWYAMGYIMKKLISRGTVLNSIDLDLLMKEAIEVHLLTVNIKNSWMTL